MRVQSLAYRNRDQLSSAIMARRKKLGDLGERWTKSRLARAGFTSMRNLNDVHYNHPAGDFLADRENKRYFVTVKTRSKYIRGTRRVNSSYNIYPKMLRRAAREYNAVPAWLTIQIDASRRRYSAYFGTLDSLPNPAATGVPMKSEAVSGYECLARDKYHPEITFELSNQLEAATAAPQRRRQDIDRNVEASPRPLSKYDRIAVERLGFRSGTKTQRAVAMYLRPEGATAAEITAINGGPYLNCLKQVEAKGHAVVKMKRAGPSGRKVTAYKIIVSEPRAASGDEPPHALSRSEAKKLRLFLTKVISERRHEPSRGDLEGLASGIALNLLKQRDSSLHAKIGSRAGLVRLAGELGFIIRRYRGGIGRKGSGIWETIDF